MAQLDGRGARASAGDAEVELAGGELLAEALGEDEALEFGFFALFVVLQLLAVVGVDVGDVRDERVSVLARALGADVRAGVDRFLKLALGSEIDRVRQESD